MSVTRLVLPGAAIAPGELRVPADAAHHARVTRVALGDPIEVLDLEGAVGIGTLARWEGKACVVEVGRIETDRGEPPAPLVLGLAVLHTQSFDWAVEKATELGATAIVPVLTERVQRGRHDARVERWQRPSPTRLSPSAAAPGRLGWRGRRASPSSSRPRAAPGSSPIQAPGCPHRSRPTPAAPRCSWARKAASPTRNEQ